MMNELLATLVLQLTERGLRHPLVASTSLHALWGLLHSLAGTDAAARATVDATMTALVAELATELADELGDDPAALAAQKFTLACSWADLCRLAGEPVPPPVRAVLEDPAGKQTAAGLLADWVTGVLPGDHLPALPTLALVPPAC